MSLNFKLRIQPIFKILGEQLALKYISNHYICSLKLLAQLYLKKILKILKYLYILA